MRSPMSLAEATSTGPLLVVIDDLQWADAGSLRLLRFLRSDVRAAGLAVLATCREGDDARPRDWGDRQRGR